MLTGYEAQDNLEVYIPPKRNGPPQASTSLREHVQVHLHVLTAYIQEAIARTVFRRYTSTCMYMHTYISNTYIYIYIYIVKRKREREKERERERERVCVCV